MKPKKFFRFLRGELNGYYLTKLSYFTNDWVRDNISKELCYMNNVQFELGSMTDDDIINIAKFAGIVQVVTFGRMTKNTLFMTTSKNIPGNCFSVEKTTLVVDNNKQVSERGLYDTNGEVFDFSYWNTTKPDITDNAIPNILQASLIPEGMEPIGYIAEGTEIYDIDGNFLPDRILKEPPTGKAYTNFYGEQFLHLSDDFIVRTVVPAPVIYQILLVIQNVRYNGSSIKSFAELTKLIVGDCITIGRHHYDPDNPLYTIWYYQESQEVAEEFKVIRINVWKGLVESFFPQIRLEEIIAR